MYTYNPHIHSSIYLIPVFLELEKSFLNETSSTSPALALTICMMNSSYRNNLILNKHSHILLLCIHWFTFRNTFSLFSNCYTENILFSYKQSSHWKRPWGWERLKAKGEEGGRGLEETVRDRESLPATVHRSQSQTQPSNWTATNNFRSQDQILCR